MGAHLKDSSDLEIESIKDAGTTGNFEITVNGNLVHSKRTQEHGFLHDNAGQQVRLVRDYM
jgi:selT/selW/selH-like putative selenoprotein